MAIKASASITLSFMVDIQATYRYYKLQASTAAKPGVPTTNPPSGWDDVEPSYTSGSTNTLYFVDCTVFTNGDWSYSAVSKSSSYEAAKEAYNKAVAAQDSIDSLQIGGRNLITGSKNFTGDNWGNIGGYTISDETYRDFTVLERSRNWGGAYKAVYLEKDETYTFSAYVKSNENEKKCCIYSNITGTENISQQTPNNAKFTVGTEWKLISLTTTCTLSGNSAFRIESIDNTHTIYICGYKLEKGSKATDWTPAPEDVDADILNANNTATEANNTATEAYNNAVAAKDKAHVSSLGLGTSTMLYNDPTFELGYNSVHLYNNSANGNVNLTRVSTSTDNPTDSDFELKITNTGESTPACGGFTFANQSRASAKFLYRIIAKIPTGYTIAIASNQTGIQYGAGKWLTPVDGTGEYTEYRRLVECDDTGTFSFTGYFYIIGDYGTTANPLEWYIAYATCFDITDAVGIGIQSTNVQYYLSASSTSLSGGSWHDIAPAWVNGKYMWSRTKTTLQNGNISYNPSENGTCIAGATGATGTGIASITEEYYISTSKTSQTGGSWSSNTPTWSSGKYIWTRSKVVYKDPTSTVYTTAICDSSWDAVNELEVGGRNHIRKSHLQGFTANGITVDIIGDEVHIYGTNTKTDVAWGNGSYATGSTFFKPAEVYTLSTTAPLPSGVYLGLNTQLITGAYATAGSKSYLYGDGSTTSTTFTVNSESNGVINAFFGFLSSLTNAIDVTFKIKLEKGDKATDWTPAPEDINDSMYDIREDVTNVTSVANTAISEIDAIRGIISSLVVDADGMSLMTQTGTGWTFSTSSIEENANGLRESLDTLTNNLGTTESAINELKERLDINDNYIDIGVYEDEPCIELGEQSSDFKLLITNTRILFRAGSNTPAYMTNESLCIDKAVIETELKHGKFVWSVRENGNLGLIWKGE